MTKREMIMKTLRREGYYGYPCDIFFSPAKQDEYHKIHPDVSMEEYFNLFFRSVSLEMTPGYEGDGTNVFRKDANKEIPSSFSVDTYGVGMSKGSREAFHMVHFHSPLEGQDITEKDIASFPLPVITQKAINDVNDRVEAAHNKQLASMGSLAQTIWERAWLIRGMNDLMVDMALDDHRATILLDAITEHSCQIAGIYAQAGVDIIAIGDDIGMQHSIMMSLPLWRRWLKPRLAKVIDTIRSINSSTLINYHSCGFIEPYIPELIEIGIDILNPIQPECMDTFSLFSQYGDKLSFWGGIGTQTTLPFGTCEEVRNRVFELSRYAQKRGGLVIGPTHIVEPEVPWENIEAFRSAICELYERTYTC